MKLNDHAEIITDVCTAFSEGRPAEAVAILEGRYPFAPVVKVNRSYTAKQMLFVFKRDGFIDRYSGKRLVCFPALKLISNWLPSQFPYQRNWRLDATHMAFWELVPTIDHAIPVTRGGVDQDSNWVTTSMYGNARKSIFTLEELEGSLHPPGDGNLWDGLLGWFVGQANADTTILADPSLRRWYDATHAP